MPSFVYRFGRALLLLVLVFALPGAENTSGFSGQSSAPLQSPGQSIAPIYWGVSIDGVPWDMTKLAALETVAGKGVSIVHFTQFWDENGVMQPFHNEPMDLVRDHGAIPMVSWSSARQLGGVDQPDYTLSQIISGRYDSFITWWASAAKAWGHPFFLRFDTEMDGNWFPWAELANGNQRGEFVVAWRHVHDIFNSVGATNATWVWCPNIQFPNSRWTNYASLYPGDQYVDWTCVDGYNWGSNHPVSGGWLTFWQVFRYSYNQLQQLAPSKPLMLGEYASAEEGGSKAAWITDALSTQIPGFFPQIKAHVWYNWNADGEDWRVESSQASIDAFRTAIAAPYYSANDFANLTASPIPFSPINLNRVYFPTVPVHGR